MTDRISFALYDATTGVPLTGATPSFVQYRDLAGNARTPPVITELGAGQYGFSPTADDEALRVVYLLDAGASAMPRRYAGAIYTPASPFIAWHLEDTDGALWVGAAPTFGLYDDFTGAARTPPTVITPGTTTYLFAAVPTAADLELDVAFRVDSPVGAFPEYVTGSLEGVVAPAVQETLGATIRRLLLADVSTYALVGSRIYPNEIPQGATLPAVVYHVISDVPEASFTGEVATTTKAARVQIDCHASPLGSVGAYSQAHAVAQCIENVLGNLATPDVSGFVDNAARDLYDNTTQYHIVQQDFTIWR